MNKPTDVSVTETPCACGYLGRIAGDARYPVRFDAQYNEYYFDHKLPAGATVSMVLYHCPMCGGVASQSRRDESFASLSQEEASRLQALIGDVNSVQEIERSLGAPDLDKTVRPPAELGLTQPRTKAPETKSIRVLTYNRLSKTADVQFIVYSNNKIERAITPKYLGSASATP